MKRRVADLDGVLLDAAVARALGWKEWAGYGLHQGMPVWNTGNPDAPTRSMFRPSTEWADGGPIIAREGLWLSCSDVDDGRDWFASFSPHTECYSEDDDPEVKRIFKHRQPLVAAMRAFAASRFGEEVEL